MNQSLQEILNGPVADKINAVKAIRNSIENEEMPVKEEEMQVAKVRYQNYLDNQKDTINWTEAKKKLRENMAFDIVLSPITLFEINEAIAWYENEL